MPPGFLTRYAGFFLKSMFMSINTSLNPDVFHYFHWSFIILKMVFIIFICFSLFDDVFHYFSLIFQCFKDVLHCYFFMLGRFLQFTCIFCIFAEIMKHIFKTLKNQWRKINEKHRQIMKTIFKIMKDQWK